MMMGDKYVLYTLAGILNRAVFAQILYTWFINCYEDKKTRREEYVY